MRLYFIPSRPLSSLLFLLFLLSLILLMPRLARAQEGRNGTITGIVKDAGTKAPLKAATIILRDRTDSAARPLGDISNEQGIFTIERVVAGKPYTLEVAYVGYEKHVIDNVTVTTGTSELNVGEILLRGAPTDIGEVKVTSEREQVIVRADKTIYGVENNPVYTATNVSELLGQIPSVTVDQEGKISLRGNDNVTILMNDRPLTMPADQRNKFLQSLPANTVKDIEIRTNPGAQFDAKFQGGIINIVTRRTMSDMFGGNVNGGLDSRVASNGGAGVYYNGSDLNASLGGGLHRGKNNGSGTSLRLNYLDTNERRDEGASASDSRSNSYYTYAQVDYKLTENDLMSVSGNLNGWSSNFSSHGAHMFFNPNAVLVGRHFDTTAPAGDGSNSGAYRTASFLLKHDFARDHKISLDLNYSGDDHTSNNNYSSIYFRANGELDSSRGSGRSTISERSNATFITTLDYENPLSDKLTVTGGGKYELNSLDNNLAVSNRDRITGAFVRDTIESSHYLPRNSIYALYGNAAFRPFEAISVQAGLRLEQATVSAKYASGTSIISRDFTNIFPSGSVAWNMNEQHSLTFSYRRSVALPDIDALNPVRVRWNDFTEHSGNPNLDPEFTQSLELSYNTFWGQGNMFTLSPYYSTTTGNIERSEQLLNGITYSTSTNFNGTYSLGTEMSFGMRPFEWLNFRVSGDLYRKVNRGGTQPGDIYSTASGYSGNASLSVDPLEGVTVSASSYFNKPATVGAATNSGFSYTSFSLRWRLLEKKLAISLRLNDPFNMQRWEYAYSSPEFYTESTNKWSSRHVGLNITYTFGTTPRMETHRKEKSDTKGSGGGSGGGSGSSGGQ